MSLGPLLRPSAPPLHLAAFPFGINGGLDGVHTRIYYVLCSRMLVRAQEHQARPGSRS